MKPRITLFLSLFMFCALNLFGQDLIVTNSKEELKTKVVEIDEFLVKYKKFDFQEGPIFSIKKSDVFLIIYSNGSRELFNQNQVVDISTDAQSIQNITSTENAKTNYSQPTISINSPTKISNGNSEKSSMVNSESRTLFNKGEKFFGIGIGTGVLLGSSAGGLATVSIPYVSARFDKIFIQLGETSTLGVGLFASYHSYSTSILGSSNTTNFISGGITSTYYYGISEKLSVGGGVRVLYTSILTSSGSFGVDDVGAVGTIDLDLFGSVYYKATKKLNLFAELSSGISNVNLGVQFHL